MGSLGLSDIGGGSSNTGNLNTGTTLGIGLDVSNLGGVGFFSGFPVGDSFGAISFQPGVGNSYSMSDASGLFGSFASSSITQIANPAGSRSFYILGTWTEGTYPGAGGGGAGSMFAASLTLSFTQTPAGTGVISDSATFAVPPAAFPGGVPEPSSFILLGLGTVGFVGYRRLRRARA